MNAETPETAVLKNLYLVRQIIEQSEDMAAAFAALTQLNRESSKLVTEPLYAGFRERLLKDKIRKLIANMDRAWSHPIPLSYNTAVGYSALNVLTTGSHSTAVGYLNTAIGGKQYKVPMYR